MYTKDGGKCFIYKGKRMNCENSEHISELLFKYLTCTLDEEEKRELEAWRNLSEHNESLFQRMTSADFFLEGGGKYIASEADKWKDWEIIRKKTVKKKRVSHWITWGQYAAVLVVALGITVFLLQEKEEPVIPVAQKIQPLGEKAMLVLEDGRAIPLDEVAEEIDLGKQARLKKTGDTLQYEQRTGEQTDSVVKYNTLYVPRGTDYHLVLSDGSVVYLNSESSLRYPVAFAGSCREVELKGEGFFQVKKNTAKPFVVAVNDMKVTVLGTSFCIRAYEDEKETLTTLVEGSVNVRVKDTEVCLKPSQQAVYEENSDRIDVRTVDVSHYIAWKEGRFIFDNARLEDIIHVIQRRYDFEVFYTHSSLKELRFSLNIVRYEDFGSFFKALEGTESVRFEIKGKTVVVK